MKAPERPLIIGITGNIASGKSTFCARLIELGMAVHKADDIARQVLNSREAIDILTRHWGDGIINNGYPDAGRIAEIVFNSPEDLSFLNSVIHPRTLIRMQEIVSACTEPLVAFEVPLLFEANIEACFDFIVLITSPTPKRLERLVQRGEANHETAMRKISSQMPQDSKIPRSDLVIDNAGDINALISAADSFAMQALDIYPRAVVPFA